MYAKFELVPRIVASDLDFQFGIGVRSFFGTIFRIVLARRLPGQAQAVSRSRTGRTERLRCRATYRVDGSGTGLQQSLRCASDSYKFDLSSDLVTQGSRISGNVERVEPRN